jgi:uracil-DNA glycosylase
MASSEPLYPIVRFDDTPLEIVKSNPIPDSTWSIERIVGTHTPVGWKPIFEMSGLELHQISDLVEDRKRRACVVPLMKHIFRSFELTPMADVKVIICAMDPYPKIRRDGLPQAQGLAFSVQKGDEIPVSLRNIFAAVKNNYPDFLHPGHGDLEGWARQGVFLLNASLTTEEGKPGAHGIIWHPFLKNVFEGIKRVNPDFVLVLWGRDAEKIRSFVDAKDARTLIGPHPAARDGMFVKNTHFRDINRILKTDGKKEIDWCAL